jgi:hypothetical protein
MAMPFFYVATEFLFAIVLCRFFEEKRHGKGGAAGF